MGMARRIAGWAALVSYLVVGAMLYLSVMPAVGGLWPPEFHLRGYDAAAMMEFWQALSGETHQTYLDILTRWDRIFVISAAVWVALYGWRGGWMRYAVAGLAAVYAMIDLAENAAIYRFVATSIWDPTFVKLASHLTMAKFASAYLSILVLIVHLRRLP